MRNLSTILLAVVMVFGLAQCKKEQPTPQSEGNVVTITLNVEDGNNNGSRVNVDPTGTNQVTFTDGDQILVASGGKYVGSLTKTGSGFSGSITNPVEGQKLYFYFLGNKTPEFNSDNSECTVNISDQTTAAGLPVISMGKSTTNYTTGTTSYSSRLYNKCSLMKFNVTTSSTAAICITGMNNKVTVDFRMEKVNENGTGLGTDATNNGFSYSMSTDDNGLIMMKGQQGSGTKTYWAIVLPQNALPEGNAGSAYSDNWFGVRPALEAIEVNKFLSTGVSMFVNMTTVSINGGGTTSGWTNDGGDPWGGSGGGDNNLGGWNNGGNNPWGN